MSATIWMNCERIATLQSWILDALDVSQAICLDQVLAVNIITFGLKLES